VSGMRLLLRSLLVMTVTALLAGVALAATAPSAVTEDEYWALVQESRNTIRALQNATVEEQHQKLDQLASTWEAVSEVRTSRGTMPVNHQFLVAQLRASPPDLNLLDGYLFSILSSRHNVPDGVFQASDLALLNEILSRSEFQYQEESAPNPIMEWFNRILTEFQRWLNDLLGVTFNVVDSDVMLVILTVLLVVMFFFVFRTLFVDFAREAKLKQAEEDEPLTSEAAFARAQQLSKGGDFRAAVRYLYLSTLLILDERGVMRYDRSKTNREYLRSVANSPELSKPLEEVIEVFDNVWYGYHSLDEETFKHYSGRVEELKEKKG